MKSATFFIFLALLGTSGLASAEWQRLPFSDRLPVNLANRGISGTAVKGSDGIGNAQALISAGASEAAAIPSGKSNFLLQLVGQHAINQIIFSNDGAEGRVGISASIDGKSWRQVGQKAFTATDRTVNLRFAGVSARYVRTTFETTSGSTIRGFGVYGATTDKDYKILTKENTSDKENKEEDTGRVLNLASGANNVRPIYAYPTPLNASETDIMKNVFHFPKSKERFRVIVYDLGTPQKLKQFAAAYSSRPTRVEIFAFEQLPEKKDWRGKLNLDQTIFETTKPIAVGEDARGSGHIKLVPEKAVVVRYIAMRFEPNYNRHANTGTESWGAQLAASFVPYSGIVKQLGWSGSMHFVAPNDKNDNDSDGESFDIEEVEIGAVSPKGSTLTLGPLFNTSDSQSPDGGGSGETAPVDNGNPFSSLYSNHASGGGTVNKSGNITDTPYNPAPPTAP